MYNSASYFPKFLYGKKVLDRITYRDKRPYQATDKSTPADQIKNLRGTSRKVEFISELSLYNLLIDLPVDRPYCRHTRSSSSYIVQRRGKNHPVTDKRTVAMLLPEWLVPLLLVQWLLLVQRLLLLQWLLPVRLLLLNNTPFVINSRYLISAGGSQLGFRVYEELNFNGILYKLWEFF